MELLPCRLPDSEISGSKPVSGSPELIAAAHVLHRLSTPRHPPYALCSLTVYLRHARSCSRPRFLSGTSIPAPFLGLSTKDLVLWCIQFSKIARLRYSPSGRPWVASPELSANAESSGPMSKVELDGFEPTTPGLQSRCSPD